MNWTIGLGWMRTLIVLVAVATTPWAAWARGAAPTILFKALVVHVDDGDTVVLLTDEKQQIRTRLASIDAPESAKGSGQAGRPGQPFSENSKRFLAGMVKGREVQAACYESDRFGRLVCDLHADGVFVNREMVRHGWAWANTAGTGRFLRDPSFVAEQSDAQRSARGIWQEQNPTPPWQWRRQAGS